MGHEREESAKERALELSRQKDALELEMNAIYESLNVSCLFQHALFTL